MGTPQPDIFKIGKKLYKEESRGYSDFFLIAFIIMNMEKIENRIRTTAAGIFFLILGIHERETLLHGIDDGFFRLFGKHLLQRNILIQAAVFGICLAILLALLIAYARCCRQHRAVSFVVWGLLGCCVFWILAKFCANQVIRRDDLWEIREAQRYGFWGVQQYDFTSYNGRYFGWFLKAFYALTDPIPYIDILLLVDFLLVFSGLTLLLREAMVLLTPKQPADTAVLRIRAATIALCALVSFILLAANIWETWFWASGTFIYGYGIGWIFWTLGLAIRVLNHPESPCTLSKVFAFFCAFCACGCSELITASVWFFLLALCLMTRVRRHPRFSFAAALFAFVSLCCLGILLGSGTISLAKKRGNYTPEPLLVTLKNILCRLPGYFGYIAHVIWGYTLIKGQYLWIFVLLCFICGTRFRLNKSQVKFLCGTALLLIIVAHLCMLVNTIANFMPPRVVAVPICWVCLGCGMLGFLAGALLLEKLPGGPDLLLLTLGALCALIPMLDFYQSNYPMIHELRAVWSDWDAGLTALSGKAEAVVDSCSLPVPGSSVMDPGEDAEGDYNKNIAQYYDIPGIRAVQKCPPF